MIAILEELLDRSELQRRGFTTVVALTYSIDLPWFEHHLGRQLRVAGIRQFAVFADARKLDAALGRDAGELTGAGTWYSIVGVALNIAFHPKLLLLSGPNAARLYIGSGNLNPAGLGRNLEMFERWDAAIGDGAIDRVFEDVRRYLDQLLVTLRSPLRHLAELLEAAFGQPVLRQPRRDGAARIHIGLPGTPDTLIDAIPRPPSAARALMMTAPFFDPHGALAVELARRLGAPAFEVNVDLGLTNLTAAARAAIEAAGGQIRVFADSARTVHAKAVFASGDGWQLGIHGSANLSNAAWRGHNAEVIVVRHGEPAHAIAELLRAHPLRELGEAEWQDHLQRLALASPDPQRAWDAALVIRSATRDAEAIELVVADTEAALVCRTSEDLFTLTTEPVATGRRRARLGDRVIAGTLVVRLASGDRVGPWTVVHDVAVLRGRARPRSPFDDDAVDYLGGARTADATEALLELLCAIAEERRVDAAAPSRTARAAPRAEPAEDWVWITTEDFRAAAPDPADEAASYRGDASGRPDPAGLVTRLLFGDANHRDASARDVEDSDTDAGTPAPRKRPPPTRDLGDLVERTLRAYLQRPHAEPTPAPSRLVHELVILIATFQDAARQGSIEDGQLASHLVTLTDRVLGRGDAPLPRSLQAVPPASREHTWIRTPIAAAACLAIYNTCLVNAVVAGEAPADSTFSDVRAVLWLRNVLRHAPWPDPARLIEHVDQHLPQVRRYSVLWVADRWPYWNQLLPFEEFVHDGIELACQLERLDAILHQAGAGLTYRSGPDDGDDIVVGLGRDQRLAAGLRDPGDEQRKRKLRPGEVNVVLFDGAFQNPSARNGAPRPIEKCTTKVRSLSQVEALLQAAGESPSSIAASIALLRRLADG